MRRYDRNLLFAVLITASLSGAWEFRYGQQPDQTAEWTAMGRIPEWVITVSEDQREVSWTDQPGGRCRGWLLVGRPLELPGAPPAALQVEMEYKTFCALDAPQARSGSVDVFLATRSYWDSLAKTPQDAEVLRLNQAGGNVLAASVKGQGEDRIEWTASGVITFPRLPESMRSADELVLGVAWGAYHFDPEWGAFRNLEVSMLTQEEVERAFWAELDLSLPSLSAVKDALDAGDYDAAEHSLAEHYRSRATPVVAHPVEPASAGVMGRARETMEHTYRLAGCPPFTFEGPIIWNHDPFNYNQWPVALNRHSEWRFLAAAYLETGDPSYAREWAAQLNHWVDSMPVTIDPRWIQGPYNAPGRIPLSLDAGIRMGQHWFPTFEVFRKADVIDDATIVTFVRSCVRHADYLMKDVNFRSGSNWGAMESNGLFHIGVMLPEFKRSGAWRDTALSRTTGELDRQVYPDGAQHELAPGYHGVSLGNFMGVMELARANDLSLPDEFVTKLERMFEYYLRIVMPDLRTPALNDSGRGSIGGWMERGVNLFPQRQDFLWGATARRQGEPPSFMSTAMPYAGWVMMRSGWGADDQYLLFDAGPFGTGHQHEDKLGILLFAFGKPLITEAGVYAYDTSQWRRYVLSTRGHSTVRIDGQDQNCRSARAEFLAESPDTHGFFDSPTFCYARDRHTAGYGNPPDAAVKHRRRVLYVKPHYWIVVDDFVAEDDDDHVASSQFLLNADDAQIDSDTLTGTSSSRGQGRVAVIPLSTEALECRVAMGETEPEVLGFIPEGFNQLRPAPALLYTYRFRGEGRLAYVLVPFTGETCPVSLTSSLEDGGTLRATVAGPDDVSREFRLSSATLESLSPGLPFVADEADDDVFSGKEPRP